jgi:phage portal protein BeeE
MPYSYKIRASVDSAPRTLGNKLGRWAIILNFPVYRVALLTGATRQTVYNWFAGGEVAVPYRERAQALLSLLATSSTAEEAWEKACTQFNLNR